MAVFGDLGWDIPYGVTTPEEYEGLNRLYDLFLSEHIEEVNEIG